MKKKSCQAGNRQTGGPGPRTRDPGPRKLRTTAIATQNGNSNSKLAASRFFSSRFLLRVHSTLIISAMLLLLLPLPLVTTWNLHTQFHCCRRIWRSFFPTTRTPRPSPIPQHNAFYIQIFSLQSGDQDTANSILFAVCWPCPHNIYFFL